MRSNGHFKVRTWLMISAPNFWGKASHVYSRNESNEIRWLSVILRPNIICSIYIVQPLFQTFNDDQRIDWVSLINVCFTRCVWDPIFLVVTLRRASLFLFFWNIIMLSTMSHERTSLTSLDVKQGRSALKNENSFQAENRSRLCNAVPWWATPLFFCYFK